MWFGGNGRLGIVVQVEFFGISSQIELKCISWKELDPYRAGKLYKFQEKIMKEYFDHLRNLHLWIERASGWLVSWLSQFRGWQILIQVGVWRGHLGISLRYNGVFICRCKKQGISWFLLVWHFLSTISSFYCIFLLMEGLRFGWAFDLFVEYYNSPLFCIQM